MEKLTLDLQGILEYQMNRHPYLMIDYAEEIVPGESAKGHKNVTANDWFIPCHFPGDPNMPGMLQTEALVQMSALMVLSLPGNKGKICYLSTVEKGKFKRKVIPGDTLDIECKLISWKRGIAKCEAMGSVNGEKACQISFTLVMPDVIKEYSVSIAE
ncbi:beta-hydroxyacyl-ACP dehydratase [Gammaproteobacteria bacterium 45_16_T64]|nr:beta-hydroxyacyl-ACP dehydratase [Gammaproteobacteria bacterium 45_16_T64]